MELAVTSPAAPEEPSRWSAPWLRHAVSAVVLLTAVGLSVGWLEPAGTGTGLTGTASAAPVLTQATDLATRADAGSSTCHDPAERQTWRVRWRRADGSVVVTGLDLRRDGQQRWSDQAGATWVLRWDLSASQLAATGASRINHRRGTLALLAQHPVPVGLSPRFVSPDGACTVYLAAFGNGVVGWPQVAVIGDSLVAQLRDARSSARHRQGLLQTGLNAGVRPRRVEVVGQSGRRWTPVPDGTGGQLQADHMLLDEIRGLRGVRAQVLALGTNDAGWVALAHSEAEFDARLDWVLQHLAPLLDEVALTRQCTVLLTAADAPASYLGSRPESFARAMRQINAYLRQRADRSSADGLRLWDWARQAAGHHTGSSRSWFGTDTIHLNQDGRVAYAASLAQAAGTC